MSAGQVPIVPVSAMRKAKSASDGIVWITPTVPRIACSAFGSLAVVTPSGTPSTMLAASDANTSSRCSPVSRRKSGPNSVAKKLRRAALCGFAEALPFQLRRGVHADHSTLVDPAFERLERVPGFGKALRYLEPVEEHRLVARKVFPVVLQHAQGVALDLRVGGIDVHDVYPAGGDRLVG